MYTLYTGNGIIAMWHITSYSLALNHCQLFLVLQPGNNWPIPALSLLVKASPVWLDKPCHGCFPLGPPSLGKHCLQCEWGSLSRCRSAQLYKYYKPSFTGTCTAEKENPAVMALAPRFDRGLSVVAYSNLLCNWDLSRRDKIIFSWWGGGIFFSFEICHDETK